MDIVWSYMDKTQSKYGDNRNLLRGVYGAPFENIHKEENIFLKINTALGHYNRTTNTCLDYHQKK